MKDWASFRGLLWTCIECWLLENEGSGYYSILISIQACFCYSFSFFAIIVLTSDSFFMVCMLFYCIVFLCHFSSFKINSLKIARCHQPDTEQDMVFQIMQKCFHHMLILGFVLYWNIKNLNEKLCQKKCIHQNNFNKTVFYLIFVCAVYCFMLCTDKPQHWNCRQVKWSDSIIY